MVLQVVLSSRSILTLNFYETRTSDSLAVHHDNFISFQRVVKKKLKSISPSARRCQNTVQLLKLVNQRTSKTLSKKEKHFRSSFLELAASVCGDWRSFRSLSASTSVCLLARHRRRSSETVTKFSLMPSPKEKKKTLNQRPVLPPKINLSSSSINDKRRAAGG